MKNQNLKTLMLTLGAFGLASQLSAVSVLYSGGDVPDITYFAGLPQETTIHVEGYSGSIDLQYGVPAEVWIGAVPFRGGQWTTPPPSPDETRQLSLPLTVGGELVSLDQDLRIFQVGNDQFQVEQAQSQVVSLSLPEGELDIVSPGTVFQFPSGWTGGFVLRATFTLHQATAVPDTGATLPLLAVPLLALILVAKRRLSFQVVPVRVSRRSDVSRR
jgi:hypothetical protein